MNIMLGFALGLVLGTKTGREKVIELTDEIGKMVENNILKKEKEKENEQLQKNNGHSRLDKPLHDGHGKT